MQVRAFPPILGPRPRLLVLGSLPGVASVRAGEYYAHPQNRFWDIMGAVFGAHRDLPYASRVKFLERSRIAVWDVAGEARRPGSLDARIDRRSVRPHDVAALLTMEHSIERVLFNGATAEALFLRHVRPALAPEVLARLALVRLPSTSPAHAGVSPALKLAAWRRALLKSQRSG